MLGHPPDMKDTVSIKVQDELNTEAKERILDYIDHDKKALLLQVFLTILQDFQDFPDFWKTSGAFGRAPDQPGDGPTDYVCVRRKTNEYIVLRYMYIVLVRYVSYSPNWMCDKNFGKHRTHLNLCIFLFRYVLEAQGNGPRDPSRMYVYIPLQICIKSLRK